jgi:hypothetical protein
MSEVSDPAVPSHLTLGWTYGVLAGLAIAGIAQSDNNGVLAGGAIGLPLGALAGVITGVYADVTEGDATAGNILFLHFAGIPLLFAGAVDPSLSSQAALSIALAGGTLGLLVGELGNRELRWSQGRWAAIGGIGLLGAVVGVLISVAASGSGNGVFAVVGAGDLIGLAVGVAVTQGLPDEAPRGYRSQTVAVPIATSALPPAQAPMGRSAPMFGAQVALFTF